MAARAKADLAKAEADFTAASGNVPGAANTLTLRRVRMVDGNEVYMLGDKIELVRPATESRLLAVRLNIVPAASGNFAANLSAKFDEPVKLEKELTGPIGKVLSELFKAAKFDVGRFRIPESFDPTVTERVPQLSIGPGTQTLSAWIEELMDVTNAKLLGGNQVKVRYDLYVREYGFLLESKDLAPPKSLTVAEFAKEVRAEKAATPKK